MKTKVHQNTPTSPSLRTTIPIAFAETLGLNPGDELEWSLEIQEGAPQLIIKKAD